MGELTKEGLARVKDQSRLRAGEMTLSLVLKAQLIAEDSLASYIAREGAQRDLPKLTHGVVEKLTMAERELHT